MEFLPFFPKYFVIALCALSFIYIIGHYISILILKNNCFTQHISSTIFYKLFFGVITVVSTFALYKTQGNSQMFPLLLIFILLFSLKKHQFTIPNFKTNILIPPKHILYLSAILFITILLFSIRLGTHEMNIADVHHDIIFRGGIIDYLVLYGKESIPVNPISEIQTINSMYHYFELWLSALFAQFFKVSGTNAYYMLAIPLLLTMVVYGTFSILISLIKKHKIILAMFAFGILFFSGISAIQMYFNIPINIHSGRMYPIAEKSEKLVAIYMAILFLIHQLIQKNKIYTYFAISILGIIYSTTILLPVIFVTSILFIKEVITLKFRKKIWYIIAGVTPLFSLCVYLLIIHVTNTNSIDNSVQNHFSFSILPYIKQVATILITISVDFILGIILFILYYFYSNNLSRKNIRKIVTIPVLLSLFACLLSPLFQNYSDEWFQVRDNMVYPMFSILQVIICVLILFSHSTTIYLKILCSFVVTTQLIINKPFLPHVKPLPNSLPTTYHQVFNKNAPIHAVFYKSFQQNVDNPWINRYDLRIPFKNVRRISNSYFPICMNIADYPESYRKQSIYYIWAKQNKKEYATLNSQKEFITLYKPNFLFIENNYELDTTLLLQNKNYKYLNTLENYNVYLLEW